MTFRLSPEDQRLRTLHAIQTMGLNVQQVWLRYFSLTGDADEFALDAYLHGATSFAPLDRNLVAHAVNELISEAPRPAAPYTDYEFHDG
jgi:hypothetical protein